MPYLKNFISEIAESIGLFPQPEYKDKAKICNNQNFLHKFYRWPLNLLNFRFAGLIRAKRYIYHPIAQRPKFARQNRFSRQKTETPPGGSDANMNYNRKESLSEDTKNPEHFTTFRITIKW